MLCASQRLCLSMPSLLQVLAKSHQEELNSQAQAMQEMQGKLAASEDAQKALLVRYLITHGLF